MFLSWSIMFWQSKFRLGVDLSHAIQNVLPGYSKSAWSWRNFTEAIRDIWEDFEAEISAEQGKDLSMSLICTENKQL